MSNKLIEEIEREIHKASGQIPVGGYDGELLSVLRQCRDRLRWVEDKRYEVRDGNEVWHAGSNRLICEAGSNMFAEIICEALDALPTLPERDPQPPQQEEQEPKE